MTNARTLPEGAVVIKKNVTLTRDNFGVNMLTVPISHQGDNTFNDKGAIVESFHGRPWNLTTTELLDFSSYVRVFRSSRPALSNMYDGSKIGLNCLHNLLRSLDWMEDRGVKFSLVLQVWDGKVPTTQLFGEARQTAAHDIALENYLELLFGGIASATSATIGTGAQTLNVGAGQLFEAGFNVKVVDDANIANFMLGTVTSYDNVTGDLVLNIDSIGGSGTISDWTVFIASANGHILRDHPSLWQFEVSNERMLNSSQAVADEYARACKIVNKVAKHYKPNILVSGDISDAGRTQLAFHMKASAASLDGRLVYGESGAGKQASDFVDGVGYNSYTFQATTVGEHADALTRNVWPHVTLNNKHVTQTGFEVLTSLDTASNMYGTSKDALRVFIGETSMLGAATQITSPTYWNWSNADKDERWWNMLRWYLPVLLGTQDGAGGIGVACMYAPDGAGQHVGTSGTISGVGAHTSGEVKFTLSTAPERAFSASLVNKTIVITATADWPDLGMTTGQKKEFVMSQVAGNEVYLQGTTFTAAPSGTHTYTEYQTDWSPTATDFKNFSDFITSGAFDWGYIEDANQTDYVNKFPGTFIHMPDNGTNSQHAGTYVINVDGTVEVW